jgi:hypothetical protein
MARNCNRRLCPLPTGEATSKACQCESCQGVEQNAAEDALGAIAKLSGCAEWEYPGQVVRDVELIVKRAEVAEAQVTMLLLAVEQCHAGLLEARAAAFADAAEECERQAERFDRSCAGAMRHCATYIRLAFADSGCYSFLAERKRLREALAKVREDVNWMLNERKFLNADVFDYLDAALGEP